MPSAHLERAALDDMAAPDRDDDCGAAGRAARGVGVAGPAAARRSASSPTAAMDLLGVDRARASARGRCARASSCARLDGMHWMAVGDAVRDPGHPGRPVDRVGLPGELRRGLRARGPAGLRRRRGHGLDRPGEPGARRPAPRWPSCTACRCCRSTRRRCSSRQRVWGTEPWGKIDRSLELAHDARRRARWCVHPPFRWQREYAREFVDGHRARASTSPASAGRREHVPVAGREPGDARPTARLGPDRRSPTTTSRSTCRTPRWPARTRSRWRGLGDRAGAPAPGRRARARCRDEHLVPGRGVAAVRGGAGPLVHNGFAARCVVEISTRRLTGDEREVGAGRVAGVRPAEPGRAPLERRGGPVSAAAGRRPGGEDTRAAILAAARTRVRRARLRRRRRCAASRARPGSTRRSCTTTSTARRQLFAEIMALPVDPPCSSSRSSAATARPARRGAARMFLAVWDRPRAASAFVALSRSQRDARGGAPGCCASSSGARSAARIAAALDGVPRTARAAGRLVRPS